MRITLSIPEVLVRRFFASVPQRKRSSTVAHLLEQELSQYEKSLEKACLAANKDTFLAKEVEEWQAFEDDFEEPK